MKSGLAASCMCMHTNLVFHTALGGGLAYGVSSVLVGHPIDTVKNKMQAQEGYEAKDALKTMFTTLRTQGILGLYRGALPQFIGSMCFRSAQFAGYHSTYNNSFMDSSFGRYELPLTGGLQVRVVISGIVAGLSRAALETPIDYWKIRRQVVKEWNIREITGLKVTTLSRILLLPAFFIYLEKARPYQSGLFGASPVGTFFFTGLCGTAAWWTIWPLEYMKSQVQAGYGDSNQTLFQRMSNVMKERGGFLALYRGLGPGSIRSFFANGISMVAYKFVSETLAKWLRKRA